MIGKLLPVFLLCLCCGPYMLGATYYVDSIDGRDDNNGISAATPWKTLAKINSSKFLPADKILLRRGSVWREQLKFPSSGIDGSPIVVDAYGEGDLPVISGADLVAASSWSECNACGPQVWQAPVSSKPNVVIFDGTRGNKKSSSSNLSNPGDWYWESNSLFIFSSSDPSKAFQHPGIEGGVRPSGIDLTGMAHVSVNNIAVSGANAIPYGEGAGIWAITVHLDGPTPGYLFFSHLNVGNGAGDGIHIENASHCSVDSVLVHDNDGAGIQFRHSNGKFPFNTGSIRNSEIHHNAHNGIYTVGCPRGERCRSVVYPEGLTVVGIAITGNKVHDNGAGIYLHETDNSLVAHNVAYSNTNTTRKGEGYCVGLSGSNANIIEQNECYKARLSGIELSIDTGRPAMGSSNNVIRYNVIHDDGTHGIFTNYDPSQHNQIIHNLIYNHQQGACIMANYIRHEIKNNTCYNSRIGIHLYVSSTTRQTGEISVNNNILVNSSLHHVFIEKGVEGPFNFSENDYYPDGPGAFNWKGADFNFTAWQKNTGQDEKSVLSDPAFSAPSPTQPLEFLLRPGSPAIGKGADLKTAVGASQAKADSAHRRE